MSKTNRKSIQININQEWRKKKSFFKKERVDLDLETLIFAEQGGFPLTMFVLSSLNLHY